jgi:hypothetical protein
VIAVNDPRDQYHLVKPGEAAEKMFADDPFMLAAVRRARAEKDPERKPWWFFVVAGLIALALGGAASGAVYLIGDLSDLENPLAPGSGPVAGMLLAAGILGYRPQNYRIEGTERRLVLWAPLAPLWRLGAIGVALVWTAAAVTLVLVQP